jgi:hypothetical protein
MATLVQNQDGTVNLYLTAIEQQTLAYLTATSGLSLESYITGWFLERTKDMFNVRFASLSPEDQALILAKFAEP